VVAGWSTVDAFVADPLARGWLQGLMHEELGPGLQRADWPDYAQALLDRFANPALGHRTAQIATDGSQKIPQRWVPVLEERLNAGRSVTRLALAAAAWMRLWQGRAEDGSPITVGDPMAERLRALADAAQKGPAATVRALGTLPEVWGPTLSRHEGWLAVVQASLQRLQSLGVRLCLAEAVPEGVNP
jgi:fructuronate reductase